MEKAQTRRIAVGSLIAGFLLHAVAVAFAWSGWGSAGRGVVLVWVDFPLSLLWLGVSGGRMLALSLLAGGAWWALLTAVLASWIGRLTAKRE